MTGITYKVIEIFTSEQARWRSAPLYDAVVTAIAREKCAARCVVTRAVAGCFEDGEVASHRVLDLSSNMPLKIEIILPSPELERVLGPLEEMVADGVLLVKDVDVRVHRTTGGLLPRGLLVRDVMTVSPVSVKAETSLRAVLSILVRSEFDAVPVTDREDHLIGVVTQGDLVEKAGLHVRPRLLAALWQGVEVYDATYAELLNGETAAMTAGDIMSRSVSTIGPDDSLTNAAKTMAAKGLKRLPVIDADKRLTGMLARIDVLRVASAGSSRRRVLEGYGAIVKGAGLVGETNLFDAPVVSPETPILEVVNLIDGESQRVVVLDEHRVPLGVISDRDLLPFLDPKAGKHARGVVARSLMRNVPAITRGAGVEEALQWMVEHARKRLVVVDDDGKYLGILGREELLRILAEPAAAG